jgi:predicted nucleic acid-binding protein
VRVLFDTNVILDVLLARAPHVAAATVLLDRVAAKTLDGLLGATTLTTIHYLATKAVGARAAQGHIRTLLGLFEVAPVTRAVLTDALDLDLADFEDAVLHEAARHAGAEAIVTRDPKGFAAARLKLYTPDELARFLAAAPES